MSNGVVEIKRMYMEALYEAQEWQRRAEVAEGMVEAFFTGCPSENSSLQEHLLAQWGRERLSRLQKTPALLNGVMQNKVTT